MRKWIIVGIITLGSLWLGYKLLPFQSHSPENGSKTVSKTKAIDTLPQKRQMVKLYQQPRSGIVVPRQGEEAVSLECQGVWKKLSELDLSELLEYPPKITQLPKTDACTDQPLPIWMNSFQREYVASCKDYESNVGTSLSSREWLEKNADCYLRTLQYRAAVTELATREQPVEQLKDPKILLDKLIIRLQNGEVDNIISVAERLLELEPDLYDAAQARLMAYYRKASNEASGQPNHPLWQKVIASQEKTAALRPDAGDKNLGDTLLTEFVRESNIQKKVQLAAEARREHPGSAVPYQFSALAAFESGDRQKALVYWDRYAQLSGDPKAPATRHRIVAGDRAPFRMGHTSSIDMHVSEVVTGD